MKTRTFWVLLLGLASLARADWKDVSTANNVTLLQNLASIAASESSNSATVGTSSTQSQSVHYNIQGSGITVTLNIQTSPDLVTWTQPPGTGATESITVSGTAWKLVDVPFAPYMRVQFVNNGASTITATAQLCKQ